MADKEQTGDDKPRLVIPRKVYKGVLMFHNEVEKIETMDTREDDIWVCSFPRSGTTLTQEMTFLVQTLDFEKCKTVQLDERFPILDMKDDRFPYFKGLKYVEQLPSPRFIKCHLHYSMLPEQLRNGKGKIIYIARNPKDVVTSFYRLLLWAGSDFGGDATYDTFLNKFVDGKALYCPWPQHVLKFWERKDDSNMLFVKYEDVVKGLPKAVRQIATFLGRTLTENDVDAICEHCHVGKMRANKNTNMSYWKEVTYTDDNSGGGFMNKGKAGAWKDTLTAEQSARIDEMMKELDGSGLVFDDE